MLLQPPSPRKRHAGGVGAKRVGEAIITLMAEYALGRITLQVRQARKANGCLVQLPNPRMQSNDVAHNSKRRAALVRYRLRTVVAAAVAAATRAVVAEMAMAWDLQ